MKQLFIVHPSMWVKFTMTCLRPVLSRKFWRKLVYINRISELFERFDPDQLTLPEHVFRFDRQINSAAYASTSSSAAAAGSQL
jgi:hypothetical protein